MTPPLCPFYKRNNFKIIKANNHEGFKGVLERLPRAAGRYAAALGLLRAHGARLPDAARRMLGAAAEEVQAAAQQHALPGLR